MTINIACGSAEVTGFAEVKDVNITLSFEAEETGAVVKQVLPVIREFKEFGIFQTQKDNDKLCKDLNKAREEKREMERERDQAKAKEDYFVKKFNELEDSTNDEIRELKEKLMVAEARLSQPQPVPQSKK
jgi:hypothetical protein